MGLRGSIEGTLPALHLTFGWVGDRALLSSCMRCARSRRGRTPASLPLSLLPPGRASSSSLNSFSPQWICILMTSSSCLAVVIRVDWAGEGGECTVSGAGGRGIVCGERRSCGRVRTCLPKHLLADFSLPAVPRRRSRRTQGLPCTGIMSPAANRPGGEGSCLTGTQGTGTGATDAGRGRFVPGPYHPRS